MTPHLRALLIALTLGIPSLLLSHTLQSECASALVLCDKSPLSISTILSATENISSVDVPCLDEDFIATNTLWLKWKVATAGSLGFAVQPLISNDDVDFVLYKLPNGLLACDEKVVMRCMMAGPVLGELNKTEVLPCAGVTGLSIITDLISLGKGCPGEENNFLSPLEVESGESYALLVYNFRSNGGVNISFGGSCTFELIGSKCAEVISTVNTPQNAHFASVFPNPT